MELSSRRLSEKMKEVITIEMTRKELGERYSPNEIIKGNPSLITYLLTESGYLMIVKTFTDDLSWKVQRELVNTYFRAKAKPATLEQSSVCQPSNTPIPKNPSWYARNQRRMYRICNNANAPLSQLHYNIMLKIGEEYDLDKANEIYKKEVGHAPYHPLDLVEHFTDLGKLADSYLDRLEELDRSYFGR